MPPLRSIIQPVYGKYKKNACEIRVRPGDILWLIVRKSIGYGGMTYVSGTGGEGMLPAPVTECKSK